MFRAISFYTRSHHLHCLPGVVLLRCSTPTARRFALSPSAALARSSHTASRNVRRCVLSKCLTLSDSSAQRIRGSYSPLMRFVTFASWNGSTSGCWARVLKFEYYSFWIFFVVMILVVGPVTTQQLVGIIAGYGGELPHYHLFLIGDTCNSVEGRDITEKLSKIQCQTLSFQHH